jgi:hypothetical protein
MDRPRVDARPLPSIWVNRRRAAAVRIRVSTYLEMHMTRAAADAAAVTGQANLLASNDF